MVLLPVRLQFALYQLAQLLLPVLHGKRQNHVKNDVCMPAAAHHAKIVDRKLGIDPLENFHHACMNPRQLLVVGDNRVVMNDQLHTEFLSHLPLQLVNSLVRVENILVVIHLHMRACKTPAGSVVVNHEIMDAENLVLREQQICNLPDQMFIRRHAEQRVDGVFRNADAGPQNKKCHAKPGPAVNSGARQLSDHAGYQHRAGRNHVVAAICRGGAVTGEHHRYLTAAHGRVTKLITSASAGAGVAAMEIYIVNKDVLLSILDFCAQENRFHFHRDGLFEYLGRGGTMDVFLHTGYAVRVDAVADYFAASMDMLDPDARASLFPADRPVRTKERADVSTYYGEHAHVENCLVADGCFIEGTVTDCILFRGVRVARGAHLSRCIVMQDTCIAADAILQYAIADKNVRIGPAVTLTGCEALPIVIPKGSEL